MDSMEPLLQRLPNLRIIHLVRDPRAVTLSRKKFHSSGRGQFANKVGPKFSISVGRTERLALVHDIRTQKLQTSTKWESKF